MTERAMKDIGVAVVGAGFIGPVHVEALRRAGVTVTGILGVSDDESRTAAANLGLPRAYSSFEEVLGDRGVTAVHLATPNRLHYPMARQALEAGKHVICEKPLAMDSRESAELVALAAKTKLAAGVNYNVRYYPLCLQMRELVRGGDLGSVFSVCGSYVQDWLLYPTDYNWRVLAEEGGELRAVADIGTHWLDLVHSITGLEVESVLRRSGDRTPGAAAAQGRSRDVFRQDGQDGRDRAGRDPDRGCRLHPAAVCRRRARLCVGFAGDRRAEELPAVGTCRIGRRGGLEQRTAQRTVDRASRATQRTVDPRPGARVRRGSSLHQLPRRSQRRLPGHVQAMLPGLLRLHPPRRLRRAAAVSHVRRRPPRDPPVRGDPGQPPAAAVGGGWQRGWRSQLERATCGCRFRRRGDDFGVRRLVAALAVFLFWTRKNGRGKAGNRRKGKAATSRRTANETGIRQRDRAGIVAAGSAAVGGGGRVLVRRVDVLAAGQGRAAICGRDARRGGRIGRVRCGEDFGPDRRRRSRDQRTGLLSEPAHARCRPRPACAWNTCRK